MTILLCYWSLRAVGVAVGSSLIWIGCLATAISLILVWKRMAEFQVRRLEMKAVFFPAVLLLMYAVISLVYLASNGFDAKGGLILHDQYASEVVGHMSISQSLFYQSFPSSMHALANDLSFYHWLPNQLLHIFLAAGDGSNPTWTYNFVFYPVLTILLVVNVYSLSRTLWPSVAVALTAVILSLFCYDLSALVLWFRGVVREATLAFGTFQPDTLSAWSPTITQFQIFTNPSYMFSSAALLGSILVTLQWLRLRHVLLLIIACLSWTLLIKIKITAYLMGVGGLIVWGIIRSWRHRDHRTTMLALGVIVASVPLILMSGGHPKNSSEFSKWFFPLNFALRANMIDTPIYEEIRLKGYTTEPRDMLKFLLAMMVYYSGLLGARMVVFLRRRPLQKMLTALGDSSHGLLVWTFAAGFGAFVFIVNGVAKYDSMWFYLTGVFILNLYMAERLVHIFRLKTSLMLTIVKNVCAVLVVASALSFLIPALRQSWIRPYRISKEKLEALHWLRAQTSTGLVATRYYHLDPERQDDENNILTAFTGKRVVCEGIGQDFHYRTGNPDFRQQIQYLRKDTEIIYRTSDPDSLRSMLDRYEIRFIYLEQPDILHVPIEDPLKVVFQNAEITIIAFKANWNRSSH
jgi:hypothetical protein